MKANNIRSLAQNTTLFRSNPIFIIAFVFISLTEVDPNSHEPKSDGTVKYIVSSISPKLDFLDLKFEAYNGAEGVWTRVDALIYT